MAQALLERETLSAEEVDILLGRKVEETPADEAIVESAAEGVTDTGSDDKADAGVAADSEVVPDQE